jgi:hypothetical protein
MSPFFLMFGREPTFPIDILLETRKGVRKDPDMERFKKHLVQTIEGARKFAVENMKKAMDEVKRQADKRAKASDIAVESMVHGQSSEGDQRSACMDCSKRQAR